MPAIPFIISGTITDLDESTLLSGCLVIAKDKTTSGVTYATTDSNGQYLIDLANGGYDTSIGDSISIKLVNGNKVRVYTFTVTSAMISSGGNTVNLSIYGLRQHIFNTLWDLYNANIPPNFTDSNGTTTVSWSVTSSMPEDNPTFPVIVINPAKIDLNIYSFDSSNLTTTAEIETEFFSRTRFGKARVDSARDYIEYVLLSNKSSLNFAGLYFEKKNFIDDSNVGMLEIDDQKYNLANQILKFKVCL